MALTIGCAGAPPRMSRAAALSRVHFIEEDFLLHSAAPSVKAMRKWRRDAPTDRGFTLIAPDDVFARGKPFEAAISKLSEAREALDASAILFRPPKGHAPSATNRELFSTRLSEAELSAAMGDAEVVLVPRGLWDLNVSLAVASSAEILVAFDPLANDPLEEIPPLLAGAFEAGSAYLRPGREATTRRRFDSYELETLAEIATELESGWMCFTHAERIRDGEALLKLLAEIG